MVNINKGCVIALTKVFPKSFPVVNSTGSSSTKTTSTEPPDAPIKNCNWKMFEGSEGSFCWLDYYCGGGATVKMQILLFQAGANAKRCAATSFDGSVNHVSRISNCVMTRRWLQCEEGCQFKDNLAIVFFTRGQESPPDTLKKCRKKVFRFVNTSSWHRVTI